MCRFILTMSCIAMMLAAPISAQDFLKGLEAAQSGDFETALKEWKPLAESGHSSAQNNLGLMYYHGWGVSKDDEEAVQWWALAAEQGFPDAQHNLGLMYDDGAGVPQDYKEAVKLYTPAAEQGFVLAQYNLALLYENGRGVPQDYKEAIRLYTLAAEQDFAMAQTELGSMYYNSHGALADYIMAHMWFNIGVGNGNEIGAENREIIAEEMTSEDISKAEAVTGVCIRSKYEKCGY